MQITLSEHKSGAIVELRIGFCIFFFHLVSKHLFGFVVSFHNHKFPGANCFSIGNCHSIQWVYDRTLFESYIYYYALTKYRKCFWTSDSTLHYYFVAFFTYIIGVSQIKIWRTSKAKKHLQSHYCELWYYRTIILTNIYIYIAFRELRIFCVEYIAFIITILLK